MHRAARDLEEMDEEEEAFEEDFDDFGVESEQAMEPRGRRRSIIFSGRERGSSVSGRQRRASVSETFMFAAEVAEEDANETFEETLRDIQAVFQSVSMDGNVTAALRKVKPGSSSRSSHGVSRRQSLDGGLTSNNSKTTFEGPTRQFDIRVGRRANPVRPQIKASIRASDDNEVVQKANDSQLEGAQLLSTQAAGETQSALTGEPPVKKRPSIVDDDDDDDLDSSGGGEGTTEIHGQAAKEIAAAIKLQSLARQMLAMFQVRGMFEALSNDEEDDLPIDNPAATLLERTENFARSDTAELGACDDFIPNSPLSTNIAESDATSLPELENAEAELAKVMQEMDLMLHGEEGPMPSDPNDSNEASKSAPMNEEKASAGVKGNAAKSTKSTTAALTSSPPTRPRFSMDGVEQVFDRPVLRQSPAIRQHPQSSGASADSKLEGAAAKSTARQKPMAKSREAFWGAKADIAVQPTPPSPSNLPVPRSGVNNLAHPSPRKLPHPPASFLPAALPARDKTKARAIPEDKSVIASSKKAVPRSKFAF